MSLILEVSTVVKDDDLKEAAVIYSKGISNKLTSEEAFIEGALWAKQWLEDAEVSPSSDRDWNSKGQFGFGE